MIELVGSDTVVAVITDSAASCKAAGQLEAKYPGITWMPCSAQYIVIPRAWGMSQMRDRAGGRPGMTTVMMAITGSHHVLLFWIWI